MVVARSSNWVGDVSGLTYGEALRWDRSYVTVEALVCALLDLGGKGEGGGTGGQAEHGVEVLHGKDLLVIVMTGE